MFVSEDPLSRCTTDSCVNPTAVVYGAALCYGRFLQADPLGYDDGLNMYNYVGSDPVNYNDPDGTGRVGWIVNLTKTGTKAVSQLYSMAAARMAFRQGANVKMSSKQSAQALARSVSKNKKNAVGREQHVIKDRNGNVTGLGDPHFHAENRVGSHIFYDAASIFAGVEIILEIVDEATNPFNENGLSECQTLGACSPAPTPAERPSATQPGRGGGGGGGGSSSGGGAGGLSSPGFSFGNSGRYRPSVVFSGGSDYD